MSVRIATLSPSLIRPIATPAQDAFIGTPASMSASEPPHTVAIDDEPFDSRISETTRSVYGKSSYVRQQRLQRALGQRAVPDLAAAGAADHLHFARRERREVVVQHERLGRLAGHVDAVDPLLVVRWCRG